MLTRQPAAVPTAIVMPARTEGGVYAVIILCCIVVALHGATIHNPLVFSDVYWFGPANAPVLAKFDPGLRFITKTYAHFLMQWGGGSVVWLHVSAIALHALAAVTVFLLIRRLVAAAIATRSPEFAVPETTVALIAATLFAVHPALIYSVAFVGEQENVIATLFALATLGLWLSGLLRDSRARLAAAALAYAGAMMSKENLIMVPAIALAMTVLVAPISGQTVRRITLPTILLGMVALGAFGFMLRTPATIPETGYPSTQLALMADTLPNQVDYAQSAITQLGHFFRYGAIWLLPNPGWMALDLQLPTAPWPPTANGIIAVMAFPLWPLACLVLLFRRGWWGLIGFGLLWPWLLYLTELATVRSTEGFVLYRMYPWAIGPSLVAALLIARLPWRAAVATAAVLAAALFLIARTQLATFATDVALWNQAIAANVPYQDTAPAAFRAYLNRGNALLVRSRMQDAQRDFETAARLAPQLPGPHLNMAVALERLGRHQEALAAMTAGIERNTGQPPAIRARAIANRAAILFALDRPRDALTDLDEAARLDPARAEYRDNAEKLRAAIGG